MEKYSLYDNQIIILVFSKEDYLFRFYITSLLKQKFINGTSF